MHPMILIGASTLTSATRTKGILDRIRQRNMQSDTILVAKSEGAPRDGRRSCIVEPFTSATIVDSLKGLFVPSDRIGNQYEKGLMGRDSAGMNWKMDQNVVSQTFGSFAGTAVENTTTGTGFLTSGWASTSTITLTATGTVSLNAGDVFQIAGVFAVNPQNRQAYGTNKL